MILALIILQVLDVISTVLALTTVKGAYEANPFLNKLFSTFGAVPVLVALKGTFIVAVWTLQAYLHPYAVMALIAVYAVVVFNNFRLLYVK